MQAIYWLMFCKKCFIFSLHNLPKIKYRTCNKSQLDSLKTTNVTQNQQIRVDKAVSSNRGECWSMCFLGQRKESASWLYEKGFCIKTSSPRDALQKLSKM